MERSDKNKGEADHAPSPLHQAQKVVRWKEISGGVERSDKNKGEADHAPSPLHQAQKVIR